MEKRVIIVDTSNEIAGDSDVPHPGIGRARRMQVTQTDLQHQVMIEAVENHMPQVIIIDEIGTELEALAARTIAEKGVQLVGTTHGICLENLIKNPPLTDLIGGIQYVTLSDDEAKRRGTQKSILERKAYPAFQIAIEINDQNSWTIHEDVQESIDHLLRGTFAITQIRKISRNKIPSLKYKNLYAPTLFKSTLTQPGIELRRNSWDIVNNESEIYKSNLESKNLVIYLYSLSYNLVREVLTKLGINLVLTRDIKKANIIIGLKKSIQKNSKLKNLAEQRNILIYAVNRSSTYQIAKLLQFIVF